MAIKVLHLIDSGGLYGAEIMLLNLVEEQVKAGLKPMILSAGTPSEGEKPLEVEAKKRGLPIMPFRMKAGLNLLKGFEVVKFAKKEGYDILHSHGYKFDILLGFLPKFIRRIPVVTTIHGFSPAPKFTKISIYQWLDKIVIKNFERIVFVNKYMLSQEYFKDINANDISVINNGINVNREIDKMKEQENWVPDEDVSKFVANGKPLLGTICRLSPGKGVQDLIDAFFHVSKELPGAKLLIVGDGGYKAQLEEQVVNLNLSEKVKLVGYSSNAYYYLTKFDMFILPSHSEGLPMVLLEAMLSESLILATNVGGIPEVLRDGQLGSLVSPKDPQALNERIIELCSDKIIHGRKKGVKNIIRQAVSENYSSERMGAMYSDLYDRFLVRGNTSL